MRNSAWVAMDYGEEPVEALREVDGAQLVSVLSRGALIAALD
jgi:hypothetical protein